MLNLIVGNLISTDPKLARSMIQVRVGRVEMGEGLSRDLWLIVFVEYVPIFKI